MIQSSDRERISELVVLVDDQWPRLETARDALVGLKYRDDKGAEQTLTLSDVALWHVQTPGCVDAVLLEASKPGARILITDLLLFPSDNADRAIAVKRTTDVLKQAQTVHDSYIGRWLESNDTRFLPALALLHIFATAERGERAVCIASDFHKRTAVDLKLFDDLPVTAIGHYGGMHAETDDIRTWVVNTLSGWTIKCLWRGTREWFKRGSAIDGIPPHDPPLGATVGASAIKSKIRRYIEDDVLGFPAPKHWFDDEEQYERLYKSLNGLTGACSAFNGDASRPLRFANLPLIAVAALREFWVNQHGRRSVELQENTAALREVVEKVSWYDELCDLDGSYFLPEDTAVPAEEIVTKHMLASFPEFLTKRGRQHELNLVGIQLTPEAVTFFVQIDDLQKWTGAWLGLKHQWMRDLVSALGRTKGGAIDMRFAVTIGPAHHLSRSVTKIELARRAR